MYVYVCVHACVCVKREQNNIKKKKRKKKLCRIVISKPNWTMSIVVEIEVEAFIDNVYVLHVVFFDSVE